MSMRVRRRTALLSAMILAAAIGLVSGLATPAAASCSHAHSPISTNGPIQITGDSVAMRTGPHTSCGLVDRFYTGDYMTPHCWVAGDSVTRGSYTYGTWSYVSLFGLGEPGGWVSDAYLSDDGADTHC